MSSAAQVSCKHNISTFEFFRRASNSALRLSSLRRLMLHTRTRWLKTWGDAEETATVSNSTNGANCLDLQSNSDKSVRLEMHPYNMKANQISAHQQVRPKARHRIRRVPLLAEWNVALHDAWLPANCEALGVVADEGDTAQHEIVETRNSLGGNVLKWNILMCWLVSNGPPAPSNGQLQRFEKFADKNAAQCILILRKCWLAIQWYFTCRQFPIEFTLCARDCSRGFNTIQCNTIHYSTLHYNTIQDNTIYHSTAQYSTVQHNTRQHNTI